LTTPSADRGVPATGSATDPAVDLSGALPPVPDGAARTVVLHEQRLAVGTAWFPAQTVRITRRIVTETRMVPVQVRTEVLDIEYLPTTTTGVVGEIAIGASSTRDVELVLHEEVPVVTVQVRPTERIRVAVRTVASEVAVTEQVSSERIDVTTVPATPTR
jgi:stress response protein YsnF